ncbi:MAG: polymer-forming cytoskeletal protein [Spirochaetaceae bacterium]|jgi:cytoskeletal protein CcmA (bactofilin family)|nr:polymer-forming cytoskeletal protein [Spirochaetaceae bacterium]
MPEKASRKDFSENTIIGTHAEVWGNMTAVGFIRIDGTIHGDIDAKGQMVIGERARVKSNITGAVLTVGGVVYGNIIANEQLIVLSTGLIIGDIITRRFQADDGCIVHGKIIVCRDDAQWERVIAEYQDASGIKKTLSSRGIAVV